MATSFSSPGANSAGGLLEPASAAGLALPNRVVLSPMTRSRADMLGVLPDYAAQYYAARAAANGGAGLLITEGAQPSFAGQGYVRTPGMHTNEQVIAWRSITDAVHANGSKIFLQIMHIGRIASHYNRVTDEPPVAPSAMRAEGEIHTDAAGMQPHDMPRALALNEIPSIIQEYALAARSAMLAGFDGVELHAMGAYLPVQFLWASANQRTDGYGGSPVRRMRFMVEVLEAIVEAVGGADKVGLRISPGFNFMGIVEDDPQGVYAALVEAIAPMGLAYLHVLEIGRVVPPAGVQWAAAQFDFAPELRRRFSGTMILAGNYTQAQAADAIASGRADLVAFGRPFINNPNLVDMFKTARVPVESDPAFYYSAGPEGYTA